MRLGKREGRTWQSPFEFLLFLRDATTDGARKVSRLADAVDAE
jgi:hypothetical protein